MHVSYLPMRFSYEILRFIFIFIATFQSINLLDLVKTQYNFCTDISNTTRIDIVLGLYLSVTSGSE